MNLHQAVIVRRNTLVDDRLFFKRKARIDETSKSFFHGNKRCPDYHESDNKSDNRIEDNEPCDSYQDKAEQYGNRTEYIGKHITGGGFPRHRIGQPGNSHNVPGDSQIYYDSN